MAPTGPGRGTSLAADNFDAAGTPLLMRLHGIERAKRRRERETAIAIETASAGANLSQSEADRFEAQLVDAPDDLALRIKLLGYYFRNQFTSEEGRRRRAAHIYWIIRHKPDAAIALTPYVRLDNDPSAYEAGKDVWLSITRQREGPREVLENAAWFLSGLDQNTAEELLARVG